MKNIKIIFCCLFLALVCQVATAQQDDKLSIYPNPFHDSCTFEITNLTNDTVALNVFDRWGTLIKNFHSNDVLDGDYRYTFHGDTLPQGNYYVSYIVNGGAKAQVLVKVNPSNVNEAKWDGDAIIIYPNPSTSIVQLKGMHAATDKKYKIYNSAGKLIQSGVLKTNQIDVSLLPLGEYILDVGSGNERVFERFLKE